MTLLACTNMLTTTMRNYHQNHENQHDTDSGNGGENGGERVNHNDHERESVLLAVCICKQLIHCRECLELEMSEEERMNLLVIVLQLLTRDWDGGRSVESGMACQLQLRNDAQLDICGSTGDRWKEKKKIKKVTRKQTKLEPFMSKFLNQPFVVYSAETMKTKYTVSNKKKRKRAK